MLENAQRMLRSASVIDALNNNKEKELRSLDKSYAAILNYDQCREMLNKSYEESKTQILNTFNNIMGDYISSLNNCEHEILLYIEDLDKYVCVCCDKEVLFKDAIIIRISGEQYNNKEFIELLRSDLITYLFFTGTKDKEEIEKDISIIVQGSDEMKLSLRKKGDIE